ncbi:MAG TPA: Ig-like domain-containing protein [Actinomycetota bacterium]|nr:Ig-like domain-containing protein [Actinomycetota bacterium]
MRSRIRAAFVAAVVTVTAVVAVAPPAAAAATLTIRSTTWDIVGLDSNKPAVSNGRPNEFPVGAKVCNTGDTAATSVQASFAWTTANANLTLANPSPTRTIGTLAPGACAHATYNVLVNRNQQSFTNRTRGYQITATAAGGLSASTPANREVYVERLVSQSRNSVVGISSAACTGGSCTVYRGQTYRFTLTSKTATQGYEQLETFVNFPDAIFEIQDIKTTYAAPPGGRNDRVYADACGWDPVTTSPTYRSCVGPTNYAGGKAGGSPITTEYTVKVVGVGSGTLSGLVYDFSGSSFHYNADFGTGLNAVPFTASDAADLSLTKSHAGAFVRGGTGTYRLTVSNAGPATSGAITVTDTLPPGLTYRSASGTGWTCSASGQTVTCTRAGLAADASSFFDLTVDIASGAAASLTNSASVVQATTATLNDPVGGNNTATDPTTVANAGEADLVVTKTRDEVMTPGTQETYTIGVRNDGPGTVVGPLTVTDVLPQGLTYVSATGDGWTCSASGQTVTCTRPGNLAPLEAAPPITLLVAVAADAPARSTNRTSATGAIDNDPNDPNNVDVLDVVRVGEADLWIEKSHTGSFGRGGTGTYSIVVGNRGPNSAATPRVVDTLPAGLTFSSASGTGWICANSGQTVTCDASADLAPNATASRITIAVAVATGASSVVTNRATVCSIVRPSTVTGCPDQNQGTSEVAAADNSAEDLTATVAPTDLALTKTASVSSVAPGTSFDYTLRVTNSGPNPATNVTIVDTLPAYIDPASITTNPGPSNTSTPPYCDVTGREVTCAMGTVSAAAGSNTATATITAKALATAAGRTIVNQATVFSDLGDTNGANDAASAPVTVTGTLVNSAPVAADKAMTVARGNTAGADVVLTATDSDGDPLTFELPSANGGAAHGTVTVSGNVATYVPSGTFVGTDTFQYRANDGAETSAPATVTVTVTNGAPTADARNASVPHRSSGTAISLSGSDPDGDSLTFALDGANGGAARGTVTISGSTATYVPSGDFVGTDTFRFRASDGAESSAPATVTVTLTNAAPTLASATLSPRTVGTSGTLTATAVTPADADGDDLTYTYVWKRTRGGSTDTLETETSGTATDTFAVTGSAAGDTIEVTITANDGHADSPSRADSVAVGNSAPAATPQSAATDEDTPKTLTLGGTDPDGDDLDYTVTSLPAHGLLYAGGDASGSPISVLPFALNGAAVTYVPAADYNGADDFDFEASDGETSSPAAEVTLSVAPVNDAPAAAAGSLTVPGDRTTAQLDLATLASDGETSDSNLTYEIVTQPAGGTATVTGSVVAYTRTAPGRDDDSFTYEVVDRGDPDGCGLPLPSTCTTPLESNVAGIAVSFDNATPAAAPGAATTPEETAVTIVLAGTDADGDDLTYSVSSLPTHGTLHDGADASGPRLSTTPAALGGTSVTYVPDAGYNGDDSFEFRASDGSASSLAARVLVDVTPVNDAPRANDGTIAVAGGSVTGSVDLAALVDDFETSDANLDYEISSDPAHGDATVTGSTLSYTRTAAGRDADELTFRVTDRGDPDDCGAAAPGSCAAARTSAPATIEITFGNAAPSARAAAATTPEDTPVSVDLDGADPDGDTLTYEVTSLPDDGTLREGGAAITSLPFELSGAAVTYRPDADYNGVDSFEFRTSDGRLESEQATASVTVTPVNDRPTATDGGMTVAAAATSAQLDLATVASDLETGDADLTYEVVTRPRMGTATLTGSTVTYTRTAPGRSADELTFKVTDRGDPDDCGAPAAGVCTESRDSVVARVLVALDYTRPAANAQSVTTPEDEPYTVTLTGTAPSDPASKFRIESLPRNGSLFQQGVEVGTVPFELTGAGVVYVPAAEYSGPDAFTFVRTGLQDSAPAQVEITVTSVNDRPVAVDDAVEVPQVTTTRLALEAGDVDSPDLDIAIVTAPSNGSFRLLGTACSPAGAGVSCVATAEYTSAVGYEGSDELIFTADDGNGVSRRATVSINVLGGPVAPVPPAPSASPTPSPAASPTPTASPAPTASPTATPTATPEPTPTASPTPDPDIEPRCGDPIEVVADGEPIVGTPCGELITVQADVPATIEALGGDDTVFVFGSAEVHVSAGDGDDEVTCVEVPATVLGGRGDDAIECGAGDDVLRGGPGRDLVAAGDGDDTVFGGNGSDRVDGGAGDDTLVGGRAKDDLFGGAGADVLKGQAKTDMLSGGAGSDLLRGALGDDVEYGGTGADRVQAGPGDDRIWGGRGDDRLQGNEGDDRIQGGRGDDLIRGRAGSDTLRGRGGDDVLRGGPGDDVLRGVGGDDEIQSGSGKNRIDGGLGVDLCVVGTKGNVWTGCERRMKRRFH